MLPCRHAAEVCDACRARVRYSRLKLMAKSPAHYQAWAPKETAAIERGRALHAIVLGGAPVLAYPGAVRRGKEFDAFVAANDGALILNGSDYALVAGMAEAILRHREAPSLLAGQHEVEIDWSYLGRDCQSHIDVLGDGFETELKSTVSSEPGRFAWHSHNMLYLPQLAFYREAAAAIGRPVKTAYVVAVEHEVPHVVTCLEVTERALELGKRTFHLWMERLIACERADQWPGYVQGIAALDAPDEGLELIYGDGEVAA